MEFSADRILQLQTKIVTIRDDDRLALLGNRALALHFFLEWAFARVAAIKRRPVERQKNQEYFCLCKVEKKESERGASGARAEECEKAKSRQERERARVHQGETYGGGKRWLTAPRVGVFSTLIVFGGGGL